MIRPYDWNWLLNQRILPQAAKQFLELRKLPGSKLSAPFPFDNELDVVDLGVGGTSSFGEVHHPRPASIMLIGAADIPEALQTPQQLVHRLFAHTCALGQLTRANSIGTGILEHGNMRQTQIVKAGCIEAIDNPAMDCLGRDTEQCANEDVLGFDDRTLFQNCH